ncbi:TPA: hypothetical protein JBI12_05965 [Legionella pneumophila]|nr:hypothetical protein [Legionella pneumophila]
MSPNFQQITANFSWTFSQLTLSDRYDIDFICINVSFIERDYIETRRYPGSVRAEEMRKHRLEALERKLKSHTGLRDGINASSARVA